MSRVAKKPINVPQGVQCDYVAPLLKVKGAKGELGLNIHPLVKLEQQENVFIVSSKEDTRESRVLSGTMRSLVNNMILGVSEGFKKTLVLKGVGYRAQVSGSQVKLELGFSHPISYKLPEKVSAQAKSPTELILESCDKQTLGQVAAEIRSFRPPEPYKGKGVAYSDEVVRIKETKKK
jgi:large subunit ribosomal protein L6